MSIAKIYYCGVVSLLTALCVVPASFPDPIMSGFVANIAIVLGGVSSTGLKHGPAFAYLTFIVSLVGVLILGAYTFTSGFLVPSVTSLADSMSSVAPASLLWLGLIFIGYFRRRHLEVNTPWFITDLCYQINVLRGTRNDDVIHGLNGNDTIHGLGGNDIIWGGNGRDVFDGRAGNDVLNAGHGNDTLTGQAGDDKLLGDNVDDRLKGGRGRDVRDGGLGANTVRECE